LVTKYFKGNYAEGCVAPCIKKLAYVLDERDSLTLKGKVHSLVRPIHSLSQFMPRYRRFYLRVNSCCTLMLTAQHML